MPFMWMRNVNHWIALCGFLSSVWSPNNQGHDNRVKRWFYNIPAECFDAVVHQRDFHHHPTSTLLLSSSPSSFCYGHYSSLWVLACSTVFFHTSLFIAILLQLWIFIFLDPLWHPLFPPFFQVVTQFLYYMNLFEKHHASSIWPALFIFD